MKTQWGVCDFIKAFIKFHGHVYLNKNLEKLNPLREKLEEQFKVGLYGALLSLLNYNLSRDWFFENFPC